MKKLFPCLCTLFAVVLLFTACSGGDLSLSVDQVAKKMVEETTLTGELVLMSGENVEMLYTDYDSSVVKEYAVYVCASKATAEEISLFRATDSSKVEDLKKIAEKRVENLKKENQDYNPKEMNKLESAQIVSRGDYVALIIADDTAPGEKVFSNAK